MRARATRRKLCTKTCNAFALQVHELARNLHGACTELGRKLVKFCTNLHTLVFWHLSRKDPFPHKSRQVATATPNAQQKIVIINAAAVSSVPASAPSKHHHLRFCPDEPPLTMTTTSDDRAEVPDRGAS